MIAQSFWFIVPNHIMYAQLKSELLELPGWDYFKGFCVEAPGVNFDYIHLYIHFTYPMIMPKFILTLGHLLSAHCNDSLEQCKTELRIWDMSKEKVTIYDEITK